MRVSEIRVKRICVNQGLGVRIFVIVYFQLLKTSFKLKKREFDWSMFFVGPIRDLFSQLKKRKQIFIIQNHQMTYIHMTFGHNKFHKMTIFISCK